MAILLTQRAPGPYIIPRSDVRLADQGACLAAQRAIIKFVDLGKEIGAPDFMYTYEFVAPIVGAWAASVKAVALEAITMKLQHVIEPDDPVLVELEKLRELSSFYLQILNEVADGSLADQRDQIYRFILRPLLFGLHYKSYFDDESGEWSGPSLYCAPQRIANRLGVAVNVFRELVDSGLYSLEFIWWLHGGAYWEKLIHEASVTVEDAAGGLAVWYDGQMAPAVAEARKIAEASLELAKLLAQTSAGALKSPIPLMLAAAAVGGFLLLSKRR